MNTDGTGDRALVGGDHSPWQLNPGWAPDGQRIAFTACDPIDAPYMTCRLHVIDADGTNERVLMESRRLSNMRGPGPSWSPGGDRLAVLSIGEQGQPPALDVLVVDIESGEWRPIGLAAFELRAEALTWSPDARRLAISLRGTQGSWHVYLVDVDGAGMTDLTGAVLGSSSEWEPAWSPDGSRVAFVSAAEGTRGVYTVGVDGAGLASPTSSIGDPQVSYMTPVWSPDGARVAFTASVFGANEVYISDAKGSLMTKLVGDGFLSEQPSWSPYGSRVVFVSEQRRKRGHLRHWGRRFLLRAAHA